MLLHAFVCLYAPPQISLEFWRVSIGWDGDANFDIVCGAAGKVEGLRTRAQKQPNFRSLTWLLALIRYSMRECEYGSTTASIPMRGRTAVDSRYDMRAQACYSMKRRAARDAVHELEFAVGGG